MHGETVKFILIQVNFGFFNVIDDFEPRVIQNWAFAVTRYSNSAVTAVT
jgi:hypothetical protein